MATLRRIFPEFGAVIMVVAGAIALAAILAAGYSGIVAWIVVGALFGAAVILGLIALAAQSASPASSEFDAGAPPVHDGVHRVLVVVDETCPDEDVAALLLSETAPETVAHLVAPPLSSRLDRWTGDDHAYVAAQERLDATVAALSRHGVHATGHIGSHDPLQAADDGLREFPADEIVFVVGPDADGDWLQHDVAELAAERYPVPVRQLRPSARAHR